MASIIREQDGKDRLINGIIAMEWDMFQKVQNIGGRASCQNEHPTFYVMRYSQFRAMSEGTLESYQQDLQQAQKQGRNLVTEKYGYMMEFTDPAYYEQNLRAVLPPLSPEKAALVAGIVGLQMTYYQKFRAAYPAIAGVGRPGTENSYDTSVQTYSIGELKTYSEETLRRFLKDVESNPNLVMDIQQVQASFYGYATLDAAEEATRRQHGSSY